MCNTSRCASIITPCVSSIAGHAFPIFALFQISLCFIQINLIFCTFSVCNVPAGIYVLLCLIHWRQLCDVYSKVHAFVVNIQFYIPRHETAFPSPYNRDDYSHICIS